MSGWSSRCAMDSGDRTPLTQREIAAKCGISRSYVSRIEKKALAALQQALQDYTQTA